MSQLPDSKKKKSGIFFFSMILITCSLLGMVVSGVLLYEKKSSPKKEVVASKDEKTTLPQTNNDQTLSNLISVALTTKQYTILIQNLAPIVSFEITDSECCGKISVSEVIKNMSVLNDAQGPWTFEKETLDGNDIAMIGTSANDYLFGYSLDNQDRIVSIAISKPLPISPTLSLSPTPSVQGVATVSAKPTESTQQ